MAEMGEIIKRPSPKAERLWMNNDHKLVILWGIYRKWTMTLTAKKIGASEATVRKYKHKILLAPSLVLGLPIVSAKGPSQYQCRFCGEIRKSRKTVTRHFLHHVFPPEIADNLDLRGVK